MIDNTLELYRSATGGNIYGDRTNAISYPLIRIGDSRSKNSMTIDQRNDKIDDQFSTKDRLKSRLSTPLQDICLQGTELLTFEENNL